MVSYFIHIQNISTEEGKEEEEEDEEKKITETKGRREQEDEEKEKEEEEQEEMHEEQEVDLVPLTRRHTCEWLQVCFRSLHPQTSTKPALFGTVLFVSSCFIHLFANAVAFWLICFVIFILFGFECNHAKLSLIYLLLFF